MKFVVFNVHTGNILGFTKEFGIARVLASVNPNHTYVQLRWWERLRYWFVWH
jgi:hypothetical protein